MSEQNYVVEKTRQVPIIAEADVCVLGGSCTGVFAAVRAARLGLRVVLIEKQNSFGGVATQAMVNVWHSFLDTDFKQPVIAGLSKELMDRLEQRKAVRTVEQNPAVGFVFNSEEMKIELDELVQEAGIRPLLHTLFVAPFIDDDGNLIGAVVENKSGRGVVRAKMFVDATGDADLAARLGLPVYTSNHLQPATACAKFSGWKSLEQQGLDFRNMVVQHQEEFNLPPGFIWWSQIPGPDVGKEAMYMVAGTRVRANFADAVSLTEAEIEGRRQIRAMMDLVRKYGEGAELSLHALPSNIGIRETRHVVCEYQLQGDDVLYGRRFDDAIANGTYRSDIHHEDKAGVTFRYLDGTQRYSRPGYPAEVSRWREPMEHEPKFYQIPYRSLVPKGAKYGNVIVAGRMIDADMIAHSAIRVMVNLNQTGEAAGTAAYLALHQQCSFRDVDVQQLRSTLVAHGAIIV